jgi:hypothetical protein
MQCGKIIYQTRELAINSIAGIQNDSRSHRSKVKPVRPYYCNACLGWHVTSKKRRFRTIIQSTKELFTSTKRKIDRLLIVDFTFDKNTMGRLPVILLSLLIVAIASFGFTDSEVRKVPTCQVDDHITSFDYDVVFKLAHVDLEIPEQLILGDFDRSLFTASETTTEAKPFRGFALAYRGPPDSWAKKSV